PSSGMIAAAGMRMTPDVAQRDAVQRVARWPDRREAVLQPAQQIDCSDRVFVIGNQRFEQSAGPRKIIENLFARDQCPAEATKQRRTSFEPDDRIRCVDLKQSREMGSVDTR